MTRRRGAILAVCMLAALAFAGCKAEHVESTGTDDEYIRLPGEQPTPYASLNVPLWPLTVGNRWDYVVKTFNKDGKKSPPPSRESLVVSGPKTIGRGSGVAVQILQNGKPFREELLKLDDTGLELVAAGIGSGAAADTMSIITTEPGKRNGIPLVRIPVTPGAVARWDGILKLNRKNVSAPGLSYSRVSALEKIKVPLGEYNAYRVETMIQTTVDRQQIYLFTIRWIAPGVGLVRQQLMSPTQVITKDLAKFVKR